MAQIAENDRTLMGFLQKQGPKSVAELKELMDVTENAVRQRLTRLIAQGLITRVEEKVARGRPVHKYSVTKEGRASTGQNFLDLASVVWEEVRAIEDPETRSQVVRGIAKRLAAKYQDEIEASGANSSELSANDRANSIAQFFESRGIPVSVNEDNQENVVSPFPILKLHGCPYPGLSERDELICEMEQSMFSELAGCNVELHRCDKNSKADCCSFHLEPNQIEPKQLEKQSNLS